MAVRLIDWITTSEAGGRAIMGKLPPQDPSAAILEPRARWRTPSDEAAMNSVLAAKFAQACSRIQFEDEGITPRRMHELAVTPERAGTIRLRSCFYSCCARSVEPGDLASMEDGQAFLLGN